MLPLQLEQITESNWTHFLGQEKYACSLQSARGQVLNRGNRYYPNYLHFFTQQIAQKPPSTSPYFSHRSCVVPVVEKYLLTAEGDMLTRSAAISDRRNSRLKGTSAELSVEPFIRSFTSATASSSSSTSWLPKVSPWRPC